MESLTLFPIPGFISYCAPTHACGTLLLVGRWVPTTICRPPASRNGPLVTARRKSLGSGSMALSRHERTKRKVDLNPLELIEQVVAGHDWPFDRTSDREIAVEVAGRWCDYRMFFSWREDVEALHFTCAYDVRIPTERHNDIHILLALINEKMWLGHFDLWTDEGLPMFRHAIPLRGTSGLMPEQLNDLVEVAISESERFYPAFQYVVWAGKSPTDALTASILETVGEA